MFIIEQTDVFDAWRESLKDEKARALISLRLTRLERGHFGDVKPIKPASKGIGELRINYGPGYRLYYTRHGQKIILLLCGGDKGSQKRDIKLARRLAEQWSIRE